MAYSTRIKKFGNTILAKLNLKIETLSREKLHEDRITKLVESKYFDQPAFPVPKCVERCNWKKIIELVLKYGYDLKKLNDSVSNQVDFSNSNSYFNSPDSDVLYTVVREFKPSHYVEIGSGNSTKVCRQAIIDGKLQTKISSIDPQPRSEISNLSDVIKNCRVENLNADHLAEELSPGDILFIDSTHVVEIGGDCVYEYLQLLPRLKPGVIVHVHDISLPYDYPLRWFRREPSVQLWNEQHLLQAMLMTGERFEILWPGYYVQHIVAIDQFPFWFPGSNGRDATSFWFRTV